MQPDKVSALTAQVDSLKEVVSVLEAAKADEIAKKWRAKLYEELLRNKKLQILHAQELRGLKENEQKLLGREEELKGVLDNLQRQLTSLTIEKQKSVSEATKAKQDWKRENETCSKLTEILSGVPQQIASNIDVLAKLHSALDVFKQRVFIMNSRVTTTKLLLRNLHKTQYSEFSYELEQLRKEAQKLDRVTTEALASKAENDRLQAENNELHRMMRQLTADSDAKLSEYSESLNQKIAALQRERNELDAQVVQMKAEIANLTEDKKKLEGRDASTTDTIQRLEAELAAFKHSYEQGKGEAMDKNRALYEALQLETKNKSDALDLLQEFKAKAEELEQALVALQARSEESINEEARYWQEDIKAKERTIGQLKRECATLLAAVDKKPKMTSSSSQTDVARTYTTMRTTTPSKRLESPGGKLTDLSALEEMTKSLLDAPL